MGESSRLVATKFYRLYILICRGHVVFDEHDSSNVVTIYVETNHSSRWCGFSFDGQFWLLDHEFNCAIIC